MTRKLSCYLTAYLGSYVGIAVAVRTNPAARMEKRRANRGHAAGALTQNPVVKTTIDARHRLEQCVVKDVDDGIGFLDRRRFFDCDGRRTHQCINLLQQMTLVFHEIRSAQARTLGKKHRDATDLSLNGFAACLSRMRGENRVELQAIEQLRRARHAGLFNQLMICNGELIAGVDIHIGAHTQLALVQRFDAVILLGKICQVEEGGEGAHNNLRTLHRQRVE